MYGLPFIYFEIFSIMVYKNMADQCTYQEWIRVCSGTFIPTE